MAKFIVTFKSGRAHQVHTVDFKSSSDGLWIDFVDSDNVIVFRVAADLISTVQRLEEDE